MAPQKKKRKRNPKLIDWANSDARKVIHYDLQDGTLDPDTEPEEVWETYRKLPEFNGVCWEQFERCFKRNLKAWKKKKEKVVKEEAALQHDRLLHPCNETHDTVGRLIFSRHPAMELLRSDIKCGYYPLLFETPKKFWESRPEYMEFELGVFRQRIYQEKRKIRFSHWCEKKRHEKKEAYEAHKESRDYTFN